MCVCVCVCMCVCVCVCSIPQQSDIEFGELKQGTNCMDTLGNTVGKPVGLYPCHGGGGNQVSNGCVRVEGMEEEIM